MFGKRIRELRKKQGLSQQDPALKMGISQQSFSAFERLILPLKYETIEKIAAALSCTPWELTGNLSPYEQLKIDTAKEDFIDQEISDSLDLLNYDGKKKVLTYSQDLSRIPEYKK